MENQVTKYSTAKEIKNVIFGCDIDAEHVTIKRRVSSTVMQVSNQYCINQIYIKRAKLEKAGFKLFFYGEYDSNDTLIGDPAAVRMTL